MANIQAYLAPTVYEFESVNGNSFGIVTLVTADVVGSDATGLIGAVRTFLEGLQGVNNVSAKRISITETPV